MFTLPIKYHISDIMHKMLNMEIIMQIIGK